MTDPTPPTVEIGDVIRTAKPLNHDTPWTDQYGKHLTYILSTPESVEFGRKLVASGRWVKVEKKETSDDR